MNLTRIKELIAAFKELRTELARLCTLVPDPELLERLADCAEPSMAYADIVQEAYDLAQRIRDWSSTPDQGEDIASETNQSLRLLLSQLDDDELLEVIKTIERDVGDWHFTREVYRYMQDRMGLTPDQDMVE